MLGVSDGPGIFSWKEWEAHKGNWLLGGLPYEWKSYGEARLTSAVSPEIDWPQAPGFVPRLLLVCLKGSDRVWIVRNELTGWERALERPLKTQPSHPVPNFQSNFSKSRYLKTVDLLRSHIREGDCYEINLAQAFSAAYHTEAPWKLFEALVTVSPVPFAAYFKHNSQHLISASPERFLRHHKGQLLTQPIKGTARRGTSPTEDQRLKSSLQASQKEQAENVMIVDLSRHALNRFSRPHSVVVPHLFEIQSFEQVHQMVSTVSGTLDPAFTEMEALEGVFPPGSMTGAPKFRVMQLIDQYEQIGRGMYAGSVGYISPGGSFDFNVVIRSLVYDHQEQILNYHVGGAITYDSDPELEYEETLLKAKAIREIFSTTNDSP